MTSRTAMQALLKQMRAHERTVVMGVINVTPDSFSDGGLCLTPETAVQSAGVMLAEGADILDIGGESTRPATFRSGEPLPVEVELDRVVPAIAAIRRAYPDAPISIDTYKREVAEAAVEAGADLINDISAMRAEPGIADVAAAARVAVCLMHLPGLPTQIESAPFYSNVVTEVIEHLTINARRIIEAGVDANSILIDPGIGFGKSLEENLELLRRLDEIAALPFPVLVGTSRKSMIGRVLGGLPVDDRLEGTAATVALAIGKGAAAVRVHDVRAMVRVARMSDAIVRVKPK